VGLASVALDGVRPSNFSRDCGFLHRFPPAVARAVAQIDLSQRGLQPSDAKLVKMALLQNANLTVLKLAYNNLGDAGVATLAKGIATHHALNLLDLGFNNMGDEGAKALARGLREAAASLSNGKARGTLQTLYLAGNLIGEEGAMAIADFIRQGSHLQKLYMTGNRIGGDGVKAITEAILEGEMRRTGLSGETLAEDAIMNGDAVKPDPVRFHQSLQLGDSASNYKPFGKTTILPAVPILGNSNFHDIQELFLGGTDMGRIGCHAVAKLLERSRSLRVLSLPNCDIQDDDLAAIAASIKANKETLPLESVQLSFNKITHKGLEALTNALWGSSSLKQLEVDNNEIGDQGAHHIAAIIPGMKALRTLDVGFNSIKVAGLNVLMKTIAESPHLETLSVSGNAIDVNAAKAVAFAMAYNCSLTSLHLIHCSIGNEGQRHISAGIVSNSRTALRKLTGFEMGRKYFVVITVAPCCST
jgi:Ran GTPase-activating protein (RanGAP) involved in mRNA processing and transport